MRNILMMICLIGLISCSANDEQTYSDSEGEMGRIVFLDKIEKPELKLNVLSEEKLILDIANTKGQVKSIKIDGNPSESSEIANYFYTKFCNQDVLVIVVRQWINMYENGGWFNYNVIVDTKYGNLIKVIETGDEEIVDNERVLLIGQKNAIAALKSGKQTSAMCEAR